MDKRHIVLYSEESVGSFAAAFALWESLGDTIRYIPVHPTSGPMEIYSFRTNVSVVQVDASPEIMEYILTNSMSVQWFDHRPRDTSGICSPVDLHGHSAAVYLWRQHHKMIPPPLWMRAIETVDIYGTETNSLDKYIRDAVDARPRNFTIWDKMVHTALFLEGYQLNHPGEDIPCLTFPSQPPESPT